MAHKALPNLAQTTLPSILTPALSSPSLLNHSGLLSCSHHSSSLLQAAGMNKPFPLPLPLTPHGEFPLILK